MPDKIIGKIRPVPTYSELKKEYIDFYKTNRGDDYYDAFLKHKTKNLPNVLVSKGPGWVFKDGEFEQFVSSTDKSKIPTGLMGKPIPGKATFVKDYKEYQENPLAQVYADMIYDLVVERSSPGVIENSALAARKAKMNMTAEELKKKTTPSVKPVMIESMISQLKK